MTYFQLIDIQLDKTPSHENQACLAIAHSDALPDNCIDCLSREEKRQYDAYHHSVRKRSYLLGRYCAKKAVAQLTNSHSLSSFSVLPGCFRQPVVRGTPHSGVAVSLSHAHNWGVAFAYFDHYSCGIDVEQISQDNREALYSCLTGPEENLMTHTPWTKEEIVTCFWSAKESLSKALKTGLTIAILLLEIDSLSLSPDGIEIFYKHFPQYSSWVSMIGNTVIAVTKPKQCGLYGLTFPYGIQSI